MSRSGIDREGSSFSRWLRAGTGRLVLPGDGKRIETKFNPWHDPDDGRFTFAGTGRYFSRGGNARDGRVSGGRLDPEQFSPRNPRNHSIHVVRKGDSLTRIAALRQGLRVSDLAWLNGVPPSATLQVGQRLMLPNQDYLDAGRRARANFLNLAFYMETHGERLPPDLRKVPNIEEQLNSGWREVSKSGYRFSIDVIQRPRRIDGQLRLEAAPRRSKRAQAAAGGADRRTTDDGGHFIAARFGGPRDRFNHFAQDASFNRGAYRALEDSWARDLKAGREVFVEIAPQYSGASNRPSNLVVIWYVGGKRHREEFSNEKANKPSGRR